MRKTGGEDGDINCSALNSQTRIYDGHEEDEISQSRPKRENTIHTKKRDHWAGVPSPVPWALERQIHRECRLFLSWGNLACSRREERGWERGSWYMHAEKWAKKPRGVCGYSNIKEGACKGRMSLGRECREREREREYTFTYHPICESIPLHTQIYIYLSMSMSMHAYTRARTNFRQRRPPRRCSELSNFRAVGVIGLDTTASDSSQGNWWMYRIMVFGQWWRVRLEQLQRCAARSLRTCGESVDSTDRRE